MPASRHYRFCGDTQTFHLTTTGLPVGRAWLRTNIGYAAIRRREIIAEIDEQIAPLGRDWFDLPMHPEGNQRFSLTLGLAEVGHFEAKCYFLPDGSDLPLWPAGDNTVLNVAPAENCCANIIYNTFVRQFGPNKAGGAEPSEGRRACIQELDEAGYAVIPQSGTFRDLIAELDFIIYHLGCRYLHLLPVHPTPTTYARMGRFGSPYAALSFTAVDPALAQFDPRQTPLEQFIELVDAVHARQARLILDIAPNHTGWAASLHETHPQWLAREPDGRIEVPGAWGVRWEDLTRLDYRHTDLWRYMADVFLTWCRRGVDGFRCDAGYMIPVPAWRYITARVREQYPDTVFFLEGLGGKISVTRDILNRAGFDWAYSELFQNYDRGAISHYLPEALDISASDGLMVHFAETHDNNRLAAVSHTWSRMRTALCALFSQQGGFGFANGVEWLATAKIIVHEAPSLNWGADVNQVAAIRRLNMLLKVHPAFHDHTHLQLIQTGPGNHLVLWRQPESAERPLLVLVNLDTEHGVTAYWHLPDGSDGSASAWQEGSLIDLLSGRMVELHFSEHGQSCPLAPGEVLCLSSRPNDLVELEAALQQAHPIPHRLREQALRASVLEVYRGLYDSCDVHALDLADLTRRLARSPQALVTTLAEASPTKEWGLTVWHWPADCRREVMVAPGHFLLVQTDAAFRGRITLDNRTLASKNSFQGEDGRHYALFTPLPVPDVATPYSLSLTVYQYVEHQNGHYPHVTAPLLVLPRVSAATLPRVFRREDLLKHPLMFLKANPRGTLTRAAVAWGKLPSRYDALLAANLAPDYPGNRRILFNRCRAWVVFQGFSYQLQEDCLQSFERLATGAGRWYFQVPCGQGQNVHLNLCLAQDANDNRIELTFQRLAAASNDNLADAHSIRLILRPDIEDRDFHDTTKAWTGPEKAWPAAITPFDRGFEFAPSLQHRLYLNVSQGQFYPEPEWYYMVYRELEAQRGLDPHSDLFSPGYFAIPLKGGEEVCLTAEAKGEGERGEAKGERRKAKGERPKAKGQRRKAEGERTAKGSFEESVVGQLAASLREYIVQRGSLKTVIAGYPWFLDWGRDALIVVRGVIAAGWHDEARAVLQQFGRFEENGTLPNMIDGVQAANRDTSDAPLWFFTACRELMAAEGNDGFLEQPCGTRPIREVLASIARAYLAGTPNGIVMDADSGLIYSPGHYTWMDTNHPAGTLRQGYPVEIQALWIAALHVMAEIEPSAEWSGHAQQARQALQELFWRADLGYMSDCRHAAHLMPARQAIADDALRPNQLLAITLGALTDQNWGQNLGQNLDQSMGRQILQACQRLIVPGAIRSLADQPVHQALPVWHHGQLLNDPHRPYQGRYEGDEDTRRKPAYHNGTAWTWPFPSFCEAWALVHGNSGCPTALAWLASSLELARRGCVAHLPEILDGDYPHTSRGCDAQAWSVSEVLRVWIKLEAIAHRPLS